MELDVFEDFLSLHCDSLNPPWTLMSDSNALELESPGGQVSAVLALDAIQANRIRDLDDNIDFVECSAALLHEPVKLFLAGCQMSTGYWCGIASATPRLPQITRDDLERLRAPCNVIDFPIWRRV